MKGISKWQLILAGGTIMINLRAIFKSPKIKIYEVGDKISWTQPYRVYSYNEGSQPSGWYERVFYGIILEISDFGYVDGVVRAYVTKWYHDEEGNVVTYGYATIEEEQVVPYVIPDGYQDNGEEDAVIVQETRTITEAAERHGVSLNSGGYTSLENGCYICGNPMHYNELDLCVELGLPPDAHVTCQHSNCLTCGGATEVTTGERLLSRDRLDAPEYRMIPCPDCGGVGDIDSMIEKILGL